MSGKISTIRPYQECTRCVMDTSDPEITFDEKGYCNHCTDFYSRLSGKVYRGKESDRELERIVAKIKNAGKGKEYDCIQGVSGGIDSSYAAYMARKLGLRVLLVHMDNGWNSDISVKNILNIAKKLDFNYQSYVLDYEEFKDLQLSFLKAGVPELETPTDMAIPAALHRVAAKYEVKYILSGGNYATEGILPQSWHYNARDLKYLKAIQKRFGTKKLKTFPYFGFLQESWFKLIYGIRYVYLLNYLPYSKKEAMKVLEEELGWKYYGGKHYESKYTGFVQSYILFEKFNIDYRRATFSTQICTGELTRDEAKILLKEKPYEKAKMESEKLYVSKKLGIPLPEFEKILKEPPKSYKEYPNDQKFLEFLYQAYLKFFNLSKKNERPSG